MACELFKPGARRPDLIGAAQHSWSFEDDLTHGSSSDLSVIREENRKTFNQRDQLTIFTAVKDQAELVDYLYLRQLN